MKSQWLPFLCPSLAHCHSGHYTVTVSLLHFLYPSSLKVVNNNLSAQDSLIYDSNDCDDSNNENE